MRDVCRARDDAKGLYEKDTPPMLGQIIRSTMMEIVRGCDK
jgi:hypothetical protein